MQDLELLRSTATGDASAFGQLVERHSARLFRLALWLSSNRADAEDIVQETLTGAYRGCGSFDGRSSVKTWLTRILVRQAARLRRSRGRVVGSIHLDEDGDGRASEPTVGSTAAAVDCRIDLMAVMQTLADEHREVITLREIDGLAYEEIAQALGIPRGTVESRLYRARAALRQRLGSYGKE